MTVVRVVTEDLGGSPLARAARRGELARWYGDRPRNPAAWRERAEVVAREFGAARWYDAMAGAFAATGAAAARLRRVADAGGVVVTTGQQPGLFGGPLMTFAKALSALALADALERQTGIPTAPVFWAATDDADFDEGSWTKVAVPGGVEELRLEHRPSPGTPMSRAPLGDVAPLLRSLVDACGSVVDVRVLDETRAAYRSDATIGSAYVRLLRRLMEPLGIAVLDACHESVRHAAGGVMRRALERAAACANALSAREAAIREAGYAPQVEEVSGLSLVFTIEEGSKRRLTIAEAPESIGSHPEDLIPNVLLRPVVERAILPTVAYVGGPGEMAYFAQVSAVADAIGASQPLVVPRWSVTIIEPRIDRVLARLDATAEDVREPHGLETRLAHAALPERVGEALRRLREDIERDTADLEVLDAGLLVPPASVQGARGAMLHRLERLERRYRAAVKRRELQAMRDVATARGSLFPDGVRQERALGYVPFLARYGTSLLDEMRAQAALHAAVLLGATPVASIAVASAMSTA